jgi:hypothetical protein
LALLTFSLSIGLPAQSLVEATSNAQGIVTQRKTLPERPSTLDHVVVIAIDGVRWEEIFFGREGTRRLPTPAVEPTANERASGDFLSEIRAIADTSGVLLGSDTSRVFVSNQSAVSLPGYAELFAGHTPSCNSNDCPATQTPTLLDEWQKADPSALIAIVSSWAPLVRVAALSRSNLIISAGRDQESHLDDLRGSPRIRQMLDAGRAAAPAPGSGTYRPDRHTAAIALEVLDVLRPKFLFIGLGDTDEYAHQDRYWDYIAALREADRTVGQVHRWLNRSRTLGKRTLLVVTTDHGRAVTFRHHGNAKEAKRIWMLLSGTPVTHWGRPQMRDGRLADLAQTLRAELGLKSDPHPDAGEVRLDWFQAKPLGDSGEYEALRVPHPSRAFAAPR